MPCECVCHRPRFDAVPEVCRCPVPLKEECKLYGRIVDIHGFQNFCHFCYCLHRCGNAREAVNSQGVEIVRKGFDAIDQLAEIGTRELKKTILKLLTGKRPR